ncbi:SGNH/GDSL hydrolase family protein [Dermatophilaceae bacterium Sec6.4]
MRAVIPGVADVWSQADPYADAWHAGNIATLQTAGRRWIVLGDSMSQGIGASAYDAGWVGQLARRLAASGHDLQVLNLSANGACVSDVLDQQLPALEQIGVRPGDVVTVMVGSNDLFGGRARRAALSGAYAHLVARVPRGTIVATLPQPTKAAGRANVHVEAAAASGAIVMCDLRVTGPTSWRGLLAADYFHPNDAGYAGIATAFEPTLLDVLA